MSVPSSWFMPINKAKFTLLCLMCGVMAVCVWENSCLFSLFHALVILVEAMVCVLDNKRVTHRNWCGWWKAILFFLFFIFSYCLISFSHSSLSRRNQAFFGRWNVGWSASHCSSALGTALHRLIWRAFTISWMIFNSHATLFWRIWFIGAISFHKLLCNKVKYNHVVEFFSQFKNASKNKHFRSIYDSCVATSWLWNETSLCLDNFRPTVGCRIKLPHISKLTILVILPAINK